MKTRHILLLVSGVALVAVIAASASISSSVSTSSGHRPAKTPKAFEVEFVVQRGGTRLKVVTPNQGCKRKDVGCMRVLRANTGNITFKFQNQQKLPCSAYPNSWILSKIELADFAKGFGNPVSQWIVDDFGANAKTGLVWEKETSDELGSYTISDANQYTGVAYYQVTVESCDPAKGPVSNDPRVENEGDTNFK